MSYHRQAANMYQFRPRPGPQMIPRLLDPWVLAPAPAPAPVPAPVPAPTPASPAPSMSTAGFLGLSLLVNTPIYLAIYALTSLCLVQHVYIPLPLIALMAVVGSFLLPPLIAAAAMGLVLTPFIFLSFVTSQITCFIQFILDTPIPENPVQVIIHLCLSVPNFVFERLWSTVILLTSPIWVPVSAFITSVVYIIHNPSSLRAIPQLIYSVWSCIPNYFDRYAYFILYGFPQRVIRAAIAVTREPWRITQWLYNLASGLLILIGYPLFKLSRVLAWIGRVLIILGGGSYLMAEYL